MHGVGVAGVHAKDVVPEGEVGVLLSQGIHLVGERLVLAAEANHSLATLEGIAYIQTFSLGNDRLQV